jgi:hypothetical protein
MTGNQSNIFDRYPQCLEDYSLCVTQYALRWDGKKIGNDRKIRSLDDILNEVARADSDSYTLMPVISCARNGKLMERRSLRRQEGHQFLEVGHPATFPTCLVIRGLDTCC